MFKKHISGLALLSLVLALSPAWTSSSFALTVNAGDDQALYENEASEITALIEDITDGATEIQISIDFGDGSPAFTDTQTVDTNLSTSATVTTTHSYTNPGTYFVTVDVTDDMLGASSDVMEVTISDCDPEDGINQENGDFVDAGMLSSGESVNAHICDADSDFYGVSQAEAQVFEFTVTADDAFVGTLGFEIYDSGESAVSEFYDLTAGLTQTVQVLTEAADTYYLGVYEDGTSSGDYTVSFSSRAAITDLATSITVNSEETQFSVTVTNMGDYDLTGTEGRFVIYEDETVYESLAYSEMSDTTFLTAGGSTTFGPYTLVEGSNELSAMIDADNVLEESDEENNYSEYTVQASGIPLPPGSVPAPSGNGSSDNGGSNNNNNDDEDSDDSDNSDDNAEGDDNVDLSGEGDWECTVLPFEDVDMDSEYYDTILAFWCEGVIDGKSATVFDPEDVLRRDEAAKIFARLFGFVNIDHENIPAVEEAPFTDVSTTEPLAFYVELMTEMGIMSPRTQEVDGVEAELFDPHAAISTEEIADSLYAIDEKLEGQLEEDGMDEGDIEEELEGEEAVSRGRFLDLVIDFLL